MCPTADSGSDSERSYFPKSVLLWSAWRSSAHALNSFGPRCPEIGAKTQSRSTRVPPGVNQGVQTCQLEEWACLFGGNADSAQRQRNGIRRLCPFCLGDTKGGYNGRKK